ncbi:MAG TPA: cysteine desulfurase [Stellaceae bacterium]|nr:cysteine desulfurase [Stellaceae bacterium]
MSVVSPLRSIASGGLDVRRVRRDFPIFERNPGLVFLDTAASAQKPKAVIDGVAEYYRTDYANVHRGVYRLSSASTDQFEKARETARRFINAAHADEIVFVRGTTEGINLVAYSWGAKFLGSGDEVILSELEHHSNIVPWQLLRDRIGFKIVAVPIDATGGLDLTAYERLLSPRTKMVALTHISNVNGHIVPVETMIRLAHARGAKVLLDGAQAAPRFPVDVRALDVDFYAFSGHKAYGPSGIGVLYGKKGLLAEMPPWQGGGSMIASVSFERTTYLEPPHRFEAGTPDISGAIGLGYALDYIDGLGREAIREHEDALTGYALRQLSGLPGVSVVGGGQRQLGVISFTIEGIHPHDVGQVLDQNNVAVRAGHHCAQPLMDRLGVAGTTRASFGVYNDEADVDALVAAIKKAQELFGA